MASAATDQEVVALPVGAVRTDGGTQSRAALSEEVIADYTEHVAALPPVVVFFDGESYWLADGFHRLQAFVRSEEEKIPCFVRQGTRRDAVLWSVGANATHGLPRTNADKRRAVALLLSDAEWSGKSDRWIAERCGTGHPFVAKIRSELESDTSSAPRTGQDGKVRKMPERKVVTLECPKHGCAYESDSECPVCADRARKGLDAPPEAPIEPVSKVEAAERVCEPASSSSGEARREFSLNALEELAAQRSADADYQAHRSTHAAVAAAIPQTRAQRMIDFVLDGGELAMLRLGVDWSVTPEELQRSFRAAARAAHPDRGGNSADFVALTKARDLIARMLGP